MTNTGSPRRVPPGRVKLISAWFTFLAVVFWFLWARAILILAFPAVIPEWVGSDPFLANFGHDVGLAVEALFYFGVAVLHTAAAVGLLRLRGWARWLAIGLAAPQLTYLFQRSLQPSPVLFMFSVLIIWYLLTHKAKRAFGAASPEPTSIGTEPTPH